VLAACRKVILLDSVSAIYCVICLITALQCCFELVSRVHIILIAAVSRLKKPVSVKPVQCCVLCQPVSDGHGQQHWSGAVHLSMHRLKMHADANFIL